MCDETVDPEKPRRELLLKMYDQTFSEITRHILVVWQSVGVLVGAFAVFALAEKQIITVDWAASLIILLCGWLLAHLLDAAYWYNRNLAIIANIERQFLVQSDLKNIHYYFGAHRPENKMITHLRIQSALGIGIGLFVIAFHFFNRVYPGLGFPITRSDIVRAVPYIVTVSVVLYLFRVKGHRKRSYAEFIENSPGAEINTGNIRFGEGHGFKRTS